MTHAIEWVATRLSEVRRNERSASGSGRVSSKHVRKKMPAEDSSRNPASIAPPLVVARGPSGRERQQASARQQTRSNLLASAVAQHVHQFSSVKLNLSIASRQGRNFES